MKGHIAIRKSKKAGKLLYYAVVYLGQSADGKKHYKWIAASGKRDAQDKLNTGVYRASSGDYYPLDSKTTLGDFMVRWLDDARHNLSPRTSEGYESIIRYSLTPEFGKLKIKDIKPEKIQDYYSTKQDAGLSTTTVRNHARLLHKILSDALKLGLLTRNPADSVTAPRTRHSEMHTLDETQLLRVLEASKNTPYYSLYHLAAYTGLRQSELLALRWSDVNLIGAEISVSRSIHHLLTHEFAIRDTKTAKSSRMVALTPVSCQILRKHLESEMMLCIDVKMPFDNGRLVFCK